VWGRIPVKHVFLSLAWNPGISNTSLGAAVKSTEGSAWISFASSRMRRTPGDLVLRGISWSAGSLLMIGMTRSRKFGGVVNLREGLCLADEAVSDELIKGKNEMRCKD